MNMGGESTGTKHLGQYLWAIASVIASGLIAVVLHHYLSLPNVALVFLFAVLFTAVRWGLRASILASVLSVLVYDFLFVEPHYTLHVSSPQDILSLVVFLIVAFLTSNLTGRIRDQAEAVRLREARTAALYDLGRIVVGELDAEAIARATAEAAARHMRADAVVMLETDGEVTQVAAAREHGGSASERGDGVSISVPLSGATSAIGRLDVWRSQGGSELTQDQRRLLEALADLAAVGIERARLAGQIADARVREEGDRLQGLLLSSVSHDLRTPLASIIGAATSLIEGSQTYPPDVRDDLALTIREEGERLNRFVGNLLDISRLESGVLRLKRDWADVADIVGAALRSMGVRLEQHELELKIAADLPMVFVDFVLLEQAIVNLLDNAIKYSPQRSAITLSAHQSDGVTAISVADEGIGIPAHELSLVFDKFYRVRRSDRVGAGTGLGLSICRGIMLEHGGRIFAESPLADGRGTRVTIELGQSASTPSSEPMIQHVD